MEVLLYNALYDTTYFREAINITSAEDGGELRRRMCEWR